MADVLGDQDEDDRQEQAERRHREGGGVELGEAEPSGLADAREVNLTLKNRGHVADQHADEDREAAEDALEEDGHEADRHDRHDRGDRAFLDPLPRSGRQVQADERHDRARDHRRHGRVNPAHAGEVDDQADERQRCADSDDAAERVGSAQRCCHCLDRRDQRERGTQVRGQTARRDQEEQQGANGGEKKRCRRGETRQQRNKESRATHGDHVLGTNANSARPRESFIRKDDVAGINGRAVTVKLPTEQRGLRFAHKRTNPIS